ncbi:tetratricopeptide repeat protein [Aliamphritea hakodatensis]|uniref:tetratricopeptide repeat protein n=1 Tax=Aliamphritea hakodatensis TaxID=2895352 RepID=UPI0022FD7FDE|nr:hypothetical protein [Aliamphritea hakodatensis]
MSLIRLSALAFSVLLTGCATSNFIPVVEERGQSTVGETRPAADSRQGVIVTPVHPSQPIGTVTPVENGGQIQSRSLDSQPLKPDVLPTQTTKPIKTSASLTPAPPRNPAVIALLNTAAQQQQQGSLSSAQSSLERAQRIAPRDPQVYYQLADVRWRQGQFLQAEQLALKGVAVAGGQPKVERRLWLLIADIRREGGDSSGAKQARERAGQL